MNTKIRFLLVFFIFCMVLPVNSVYAEYKVEFNENGDLVMQCFDIERDFCKNRICKVCEYIERTLEGYKITAVLGSESFTTDFIIGANGKVEEIREEVDSRFYYNDNGFLEKIQTTSPKGAEVVETYEPYVSEGYEKEVKCVNCEDEATGIKKEYTHNLDHTVAVWENEGAIISQSYHESEVDRICRLDCENKVCSGDSCTWGFCTEDICLENIVDLEVSDVLLAIKSWLKKDINLTDLIKIIRLWLEKK